MQPEKKIHLARSGGETAGARDVLGAGSVLIICLRARVKLVSEAPNHVATGLNRARKSVGAPVAIIPSSAPKLVDDLGSISIGGA